MPFLLSVAMVASSGDLGLLILPLPFLLGLWLLQGFAPAGFTLEEDGIRIERRWLSRLLPYATIRAVDREPRSLGGVGAVGLNGLFGSQGPRWNPRTGWHYLAITNTADLVYLHTTGGLVVLSPSRPDEFAARLGRRLAKEVSS
ncbi:MAG TPA: PH domain-containing protein [Methylomirabilota bacterium]|nr:PH domain-containing protein [Methylomirabilota bacterium]